MRRRKCEVANTKERNYDDATAKREGGKAKVRGCEGEETNYFRSFALSPFMFAELSIVWIKFFFLGEGGGGPK